MLGSDIYCQKDKRKDRGLREETMLESWLEISWLHETFFLPASASGNFQQKMSAEYDWVRSSAAQQHATAVPLGVRLDALPPLHPSWP